ncbi:hypothetical protein CSB69_1822 [Morganella morganii]|nr:hypothetical protein CSB69_1822 [Morganella morganii]EMP53602.1 hypothetical protein C790_00118 [Morganella morganii SC01]
MILDFIPPVGEKKRIIVPKMSLCGKSRGIFAGKRDIFICEFYLPKPANYLK